MSDQYYTIEIYTDENRPSLLDDIKSLSTSKQIAKMNEPEPEMMITELTKPKKQKKEKKKKKKSLLLGAFDTDENSDNDNSKEIDEETLLDVDEILLRSEEEDQDQSIIDDQKRGYKKLKNNDNPYKKEFAEELTLLYTLLDETSAFGKTMESDLKALKGNKVRGVSKYTNDLAELVLSSKQNKLNILKEISNLKKTIVDLKIKSEAKDKKTDDTRSPEYLASAYFKNVLNHGRNNFIENLTGVPNNNPYEDNEGYDSLIDNIETTKRKDRNAEIDEYDKYNQFLRDRLDGDANPYRSREANKYIEYENRGVKIFIKKCIDTGDWDFAAIDKHKQEIYDYPLPTKRDAGRMRFSDDGQYATDSKGRMYTVMEYYLPNDDDDDDN